LCATVPDEEKAMEKRRLGRSDLMVAPLVFGGNVFGWTADETTSFNLLDAFVDAGGTMIDTADTYSAWAPGNSGGESEAIIGRWLKRSGKRDEVQIATKVGFADGLAPEAIRKACEGSLQRLGIERIDLYYQHRDDEAVPLAESLGAMDALVKSGKVRALGLSQFTPDRLHEAMHTCKTDGLAEPCALQTWYNLVERERLEGPLLDTALEHGLGVLPFFSLANGFLSGKYRSREDLDKSVRGVRSIEYLEGRGLRVLEALDEVAAETQAPLASVALAWTRAQPGIAAPIASATNLAQLAELLTSLRLELSDAQLDTLTAAST
jgi:aryl-alcohol dehydrogenase-like predicted oxidoreductase